MAKFKKEDGTEVEAFTQEELDAKLGEKTKEFETKIADLTKKIEEGGGSDGQKNRLKQEKEEAEKKLKEVTDGLTKQIKDLETKVFGGAKSKFIKSVSKDGDTQKKIEAKVDALMKTGEYANDEEGIRKAVTDAATLINGKAPAPGIMDGIAGAGDRGAGGEGAGAGAAESEAAKAQRKLLGISDEDATKFAPKPKTT